MASNHISLETEKLIAKIRSEQVPFKAHLEPIDSLWDKKLMINVAADGASANRTMNPNIPYTTKEITQEVVDGYRAGASIWHMHQRDPVTGSAHMPPQRRVEIQKEWADSIFTSAPDIITCVGSNYVVPQRYFPGTLLVDPESIMAENRMAPLIEPLIKLGPKNRYCEICICLCRSFALGGTLISSFNPRIGVQSDIRYYESRGIRIEISPFSTVDIEDLNEWVTDQGLAKPPVILDILMGVHNSSNPRPMMEAFEFMHTMRRMLHVPEGFLWQAIVGGRYWLPLAVEAIMLGADAVRVGMEDSVHMYPHKNDYVESNGKVIETVANIARYLGREVATPSEARAILQLPQIPANKTAAS
jgi:Uncharacterized conserved protein